MGQFIVVLLIVGAVTGFFFGADAAMKAGIQTLSLWIYLGLAVAFLEPIVRVVGFLYFIVKSFYRSLRRRRV